MQILETDNKYIWIQNGSPEFDQWSATHPPTCKYTQTVIAVGQGVFANATIEQSPVLCNSN